MSDPTTDPTTAPAGDAPTADAPNPGAATEEAATTAPIPVIPAPGEPSPETSPASPATPGLAVSPATPGLAASPSTPGPAASPATPVAATPDGAAGTGTPDGATDAGAPDGAADAGTPDGAAEDEAAPLFAPYPDAASGAGFAGYPAAEAGFASYLGAESAAPAGPPTAVVRPDGTTACPGCDHPIEAWSGFCEVCGQTLTPTAPMPKAAPVPDPQPPATSLHPCAECGGPIGADLYCQQCGAKAPTARDHFREAPASWVAGVCDRGIRHHRNEDALALAADDEPGSRAVLIVCDGVSNAEDSHIASLAAARAARGVLTSVRPDEAEDRATVYADAMGAAATAANDAVVERTPDDSVNPPSCTYAVAVVDRGVIVHGNLGDSRVYWIDDEPGRSRQLSVDDSVAQARIAMGVDRETAENGPQAHAITRWLGRDTPDLVPTTGSLAVPGTGWVLVCSDGLWNYASTAEQLGALVREAISRNPGNQRVRSLAVSLVRWARLQGGKDNITVALARIGEHAAPAADVDTTVLADADTGVRGDGDEFPVGPEAGARPDSGPAEPRREPQGETVPAAPGTPPAAADTLDRTSSQG